MLHSYLNADHPVPLTEQVFSTNSAARTPSRDRRAHAEDVIREFDSLFKHQPS
jgi:hypothetical protein